MKKQFIFLIIIIFHLTSFAQTKFEEGYFIDNNGNKTECFIKNINWKNNPDVIKYKSKQNLEAKTESIENIQEFRVAGQKHKRFTVKIDRSSDRLSELKLNTKEPKWEEATLFLKCLVEGKASLYYLEDIDLRRFFYTIDEGEANQLIYKRYMNDRGQAIPNESFKNQLWTNFSCKTLTLKDDISKIEYNKKDLEAYFIKYNNCAAPDFKDPQEGKTAKELFVLRLRVGATNQSLATNNRANNSLNASYNKSISPRLGIEAEFILPFHNNRWSVLFESSLQQFVTEKEVSSQWSKVNYKSLDLIFGLRYHFFLNDHSHIFITGSYIRGHPFKSSIEFQRSGNLKIDRHTANINLGLGYSFNNRFNLELRYGLGRDILINYFYWSSNYRLISLILGYNLVGKKY